MNKWAKMTKLPIKRAPNFCDPEHKSKTRTYYLERIDPPQECAECKPVDMPKMLDLPPYEPCWTCKYQDKPEKVVLLAPRRCTLYPEKRMRRLIKMIPNFDHCLTLYTKCDFELERCTQQQLLLIERQYKEYNEFMNEELEEQLRLIKDMWAKSQRYMMLSISACCIKPYPEIVSKDAEERAKCAFFISLRLINESNCRLGFVLKRIKESIQELNRRCTLLDHTVCSPFIKGNAFIRPLKYYREVINDMFECFYSILCKLKAWVELITLTDSGSIEDYEVILKITLGQEEGVLLYSMDNCRCRRSKRTECIDRHVPCWCNLMAACRQWHLKFDGNDPDYQDPKISEESQ